MQEMKVIALVEEMQDEARSLRRDGRRIGLVPTMGYLHGGHLSLIRLAREQSDFVIVSIFVNPTQFAPGEDLDSYPRDFERDEELCREEGVDFVFYPCAEDMYFPDSSVYVVEESLSRGLCGRARPTHFRGVCTVVAKLFNIVQPDLAVFGEKDYQQLAILRRMVRDLNFPLEIVAGPIVRETDGLAISSRNTHLDPDERRQAVCLRRALDLAEHLHAGGERNAERIIEKMRSQLASVPSARIDYIELVDADTLQPVELVSGRTLVALAVFIGDTRLIDNTVIA